MNKLLLAVVLSFPLIANAGWFSFMGDVASISSAMNSGGNQSVSQSDMKDLNSYLWNRRVQKIDGYKFLAEALEESNKIGYLDTAAHTYYTNGEKEKAIELYETRILPTARATCSDCVSFYKKIVGLKSEQPIPYEEIYKRNKQRKEKKSELTKADQETSSIKYAVWGIFLVMLLNLYLNQKHTLGSVKN